MKLHRPGALAHMWNGSIGKGFHGHCHADAMLRLLHDRSSQRAR
jgi:hypothetical protein